MLLDYIIVPIINTVYGSLTLVRMLPAVPFFAWVIIFVATITFLNLRGIRTTARSNEILWQSCASKSALLFFLL